MEGVIGSREWSQYKHLYYLYYDIAKGHDKNGIKISKENIEVL